MNLIKRFFTEFSLLKRVSWAMAASVPMALLLQYLQPELDANGVVVGTHLFYDYTVTTFGNIGTMFINSLKMLVIPIVFVSMTCGITSMKDMSQLGGFATKTMGLYIMTTIIAVSFSLSLASFIGLGSSAKVEAPAVSGAASETASVQSIGEMLVNVIPSNPIVAMAEGNMLAIIFMAMMFGISISVLGNGAKKVNELMNDVNDVLLEWIKLLMLYFAPIGVFVLLSKALGTQDVNVFISLLAFFAFTSFALIFHGAVVIGLIFKFATKLSLKTFFSKAKGVIFTAISTSSSSATLPVTMKTLEERMGVDNSVASFTAPMGSTINMDGTAIMQGVATVFLANLYGIDLSFGLAMVLQNVGVPVEGIALLAGIDRLLDMLRTALNVTGDMAVSVIVAKKSGELDENVFNDPDAGLVDIHPKFHSDELKI